MIPQIIAHRGASYLAPENTLAAFRKAMEICADGVEMDVQKTLDGGLVIHHDYIIDLHTDISGRIYDMTEGELKDLDFGSWKDVAYKGEKIATLADALALCRSMEGCTVQLELKSTMDNDPAFVSGVVDAIRAADIADRLVLISFNHDLLRQAKALMPELRVGVLLYGAFESMVLPPPVIWKDLGLVNGMEDEEAALDEELAALPVDDADKFQMFLLEEFYDHGDTVLFAPGEPFYATPGKGKNEIRIAYVLKQADLERAMDLLAKGIAAYNAR